MTRFLSALVLMVSCLSAQADDLVEITKVSDEDIQQALQVTVIDPYLELHTGPGRGYPVIYVVEKGESISVISRRTTWYLIADQRGKSGWVTRESLARTLMDTGTPVALPDTRHGDFLAHKARLGFAVGKQEGSEQVAMIAGYRLSKRFGIEAEYGQVFAETVDGNQQSVSLIVEPTDRWSFTPFVSLGYGRQELNLKEKLPGTRPVADDFRSFGAGINMYIGFNFVLRGEYRNLTILSENDNVSNALWRIGFSSFF
ncbi:SH3 domain-containing protein [Thalassolituus sp. LLYu03]|uniref:SH3 domain-containing protein n=1 Tax=Thalassolituus sp. LLYu03 TaxID=3421656 RepID=UPI003D2DA446